VALNSWYAHHRMDNLPLVKIGEDATQKPVMHNAPRKNLTIVVLGETSRADNFSLGGYSRRPTRACNRTTWSTSRKPPPAARQRGFRALHVLQYAARAL
jgi:glucan phosphoethanolaminetransferase (alkaline phosphatase superfamily)